MRWGQKNGTKVHISERIRTPRVHLNLVLCIEEIKEGKKAVEKGMEGDGIADVCRG